MVKLNKPGNYTGANCNTKRRRSRRHFAAMKLAAHQPPRDREAHLRPASLASKQTTKRARRGLKRKASPGASRPGRRAPGRAEPQKAGRDIDALGRARHPERAHEKKQGRRSRSCNPCFFESGCYGDGGRP